MSLREARPLKTNPDDYWCNGRLPDNPTAAELAAWMEAGDRAMARQREIEAYRTSGALERNAAEARRLGIPVQEYLIGPRANQEDRAYALAHMYNDLELIRAYEAEQARKTAASAAIAGTERADYLRAELDRQQAMADALCRKQATQVEWEVKSVPVPFERVKLMPGPDGEGRFTGYASTFGPPPDLTNDIVDRDAFRASLAAAKAKGGRVLYPLLFSHDPQLPIGGIVAAREDGKGLKVEGVIATDVQAGRDAYAVLQKGYISGLSIGYRVGKADYDLKGVRHLKEIQLLECSLVVFPANPAAGVTDLG